MAYRWITDAVLSQYDTWEETRRFTLCPVEIRPGNVLSYSVHKNGAVLSRESQHIMAPGDYGLYTIGKNTNAGYVTFAHRRPQNLRFPGITYAIFANGVRGEIK